MQIFPESHHSMTMLYFPGKVIETVLIYTILSFVPIYFNDTKNSLERIPDREKADSGFLWVHVLNVDINEVYLPWLHALALSLQSCILKLTI